MNKDQEKRYSAKQLLDHPWFVKMGKQTIPEVDKEYKFRILKNLMNFSKANKF